MQQAAAGPSAFHGRAARAAALVLRFSKRYAFASTSEASYRPRRSSCPPPPAASSTPSSAGDTPSAAALLAPDATFHSPIRDYAGAEQIDSVWQAVAGVIHSAQPLSVHERDGETIAFFAATINEQPVDGVLRTLDDDANRVRDITLMIRPWAALKAGHRGHSRLSPRPCRPGHLTVVRRVRSLRQDKALLVQSSRQK